MALFYFVTTVDIFFVSLAVFVFVKLWRLKRRYASLPPGPRGLPIVGNILDMPSEKEWLTFARWGERWGDICSITIMGQPIIILNSVELAVEILDKKSSIYSDRAPLQMAGELVGWKNNLGLLPYGDRFRHFRRLLHQSVGIASSMKQLQPLEESENHRFLRRVMDRPADLAAHIRQTAGAIILRVAYGYKVEETNDPFIKISDKAMEEFSLSASPGAFLVDVIPALRHIPSWFPGAGFQKIAKARAITANEMADRPYHFVKQQMASGTALASLTSDALENKHLTPEEEFDLKWAAVSLYAGGADTTVSAIYSFFLAMTMYPEVMKKAQAEIDAVVGNDRLPTFADREHLPYINALAKEVLRWNAVVPFGIPHRSIQDDIHAGYLIPKGSLVIANLWKLLHDPGIYPDPHLFNPERFIASEEKTVEPDPYGMCFGFGRRICPGMHLADLSVFISCAMSLAVFDISKYVENGVVIEPVYDNMAGAISHPKPFKCSIEPRSPRAVSLIQGEQFE